MRSDNLRNIKKNAINNILNCKNGFAGWLNNTDLSWTQKHIKITMDFIVRMFSNQIILLKL